MKWNLLVIALTVLSGCVAQKNTIRPTSRLHFIGTYTLPNDLQYQGTTVGGLSGIDFDAKNNWYYLICDDGSKINPARFYTAKIRLSSYGIDTVELINVTTLLQPNDSAYPKNAVDPEAMRLNAGTKQLYWTSEGERTIKKEGLILRDPFVHITDRNGNNIDSLYLPSNMHMNVSEKGPRNNGSFEGLAFADKYRTVYVAMEEPTYEDGPRAGLDDSTAWIRILKFDAVSKKPLAQYAYQIDAVAHPASPAGSFKINGIADILSNSSNQLLVVERSFSTGYPNNTIRLYRADLANATDISGMNSLHQQRIKPVSKQLLLNMDSLDIYIDNIEGVTYGPKLLNGHQSLIFVTDNNFSAVQKTQFLLFEIEQ